MSSPWNVSKYSNEQRTLGTTYPGLHSLDSLYSFIPITVHTSSPLHSLDSNTLPPTTSISFSFDSTTLNTHNNTLNNRYIHNDRIIIAMFSWLFGWSQQEQKPDETKVNQAIEEAHIVKDYYERFLSNTSFIP